MREILDAQRAAFMAELPVGLDVRKDRLKRAAAMVRDNASRFCDALSEDFGHRSRQQSMITDIASSVSPLDHARKSLDRWARREKKPVMFPLGLLDLVMSPLAGVFAAGNRAMVKTSEFTPVTAALFEEVAPKYFDPTELAFISGGPDVGKAFASLPFDHLLFTGATGVGRHILHAAADNLTPVTLELGGKSPAILGRSANLAQATERVAMGKMLNAGQICIAPDYLMVAAEQEAAAVDGIVAAASAMYPTLLSNPDYTSVVNDRHYARLTAAIADAREKGAEVIEVNPANEDFASSNSRKLPLHIVRNPTDDMIVMQEEIFGPILPVRKYDSIDGAIAEVNRRDRPLALYYFGTDEGERRRVLDRTISGGVSLDDTIFHVSMEELPFGGIGPSGMGAYHGEPGFRTFSHAKSVFKQSKLNVAKLGGLMPPYGKATDTAIKRQIG